MRSPEMWASGDFSAMLSSDAKRSGRQHVPAGSSPRMGSLHAGVGFEVNRRRRSRRPRTCSGETRPIRCPVLLACPCSATERWSRNRRSPRVQLQRTSSDVLGAATPPSTQRPVQAVLGTWARLQAQPRRATNMAASNAMPTKSEANTPPPAGRVSAAGPWANSAWCRRCTLDGLPAESVFDGAIRGQQVRGRWQPEGAASRIRRAFDSSSWRVMLGGSPQGVVNTAGSHGGRFIGVRVDGLASLPTLNVRYPCRHGNAGNLSARPIAVQGRFWDSHLGPPRRVYIWNAC